jgi:hypothetical protein
VISSVLALKIATANGFSGTVITDASGNATVTLGITVDGLLKGVGGALVPAIAGSDYVASIGVTAPILNTGTSANPVIALAVSGVIAGTYGDAAHVARVTVDAHGLVTAITAIAIDPIPIAVGSTASRPVSPVNGTQYLDTDIGQPIWALNTASLTGWINAAGVSV